MNIDNLSIQIETSTTAAEKGLDNLNKKLGNLNTTLGSLNVSNLSALTGGIGDLAVAMQTLHNATNGRDFTNLTNWLTKLSALSGNADSLTTVATSIREIGASLTNLQSVGSAAADISNLVSGLKVLGGKAVEKAVINMPELTRALQQMITTLAQTPGVNANITKLISAIAELAKQGSKINSATKAMGTNIRKATNDFNGFRISTLRLSSVIGRVYGELWLLIRAFKFFGNAVKEAMDYRETLNYFEKAFKDIRDKADLSPWKTLGYESAEAYYNSFLSRANDVTKQLSNITVGDNGIEQSQKSVGLSGNSVAKYQTQYAQMASSMGVSSENAMHLSEVLIKLGGDLASIKDMDFDQVWKDMTSGMAGMSRTMDKYGANIRVAALDQKLLDLGINATSKELSQQDKVLLRVITMLDSTDFAWGDLTDTIDTGANQLRIAKSNFKDLSVIIGQMAVPALQSFLPYVNAMLKALQSLAIYVANLFGLNISREEKDVGEDLSSISDYLDDIDSSASDATDSAKKLKQQLLGIDEINNITTDKNSKNDSGVASGLLNKAFLDASENYLNKWQEGFDKMKNSVDDISKTIQNSKGFKTLTKLFDDVKKGDWKAVGTDVSTLFTWSTDGITDLLKKVDWEKVGKNIGEFLNGFNFADMIESLSGLIDKIIMSALDLWAGSFEEAPLETLLITAITGMTFTNFGRTLLGNILTGIAAALIGFDIGKEISKVIFGKDDGDYDATIFDLKVIFTDFGISSEALQQFRNEHPVIYSAIMGGLGVLALPMQIELYTNDIVDAFNWLKEHVFTPIYDFIQERLDKAKESWEGLGYDIGFTVGTKFEEFKESIKGLEDSWISFVDSINPTKIIDKVSEIDDYVRDEFLPNLWENIVSFFSTHSLFDLLLGNGSSISSAGATHSYSGKSFKVGAYADGGFTSASLFYAGENGVPEMVGTVGGRSAVASGSEITGISDTIRSTSSQEVELLRQQNELLTRLLAKPMGITHDDIFNSVRTSANDFSRATGRLAF